MSYRCKCGEQVPRGQKQLKVVLERRKVVYVDGSTGWEIVYEPALCPECYDFYKGQQPGWVKDTKFVN